MHPPAPVDARPARPEAGAPEAAPALAPEPATLAARFAAEAARGPDRLAVRDGDRSLTYAELAHAAFAIARAIHEVAVDGGAGVDGGRRQTRPGDDRASPRAAAPVAVLAAPGAEAIVAILGALVAGHPYLPLDPADPLPRATRILADAAPAVLLFDAASAGAARAIAEALAQAGDSARPGASLDRRARSLPLPLLPADATARSAGAGEPAALLAAARELQPDPDAPAAILYTSGTTGLPKGVVRSHRATLHHLANHARAAGLQAGDRVTLLASPSRATSVADLLGTLCRGAAVLPYDVRRGGLRTLVEMLEREAVTHYASVPSLFREVAPLLPPAGRLAHLRVLRLGGEAVTRRDVELYRRHAPDGSTLLVWFGCTETQGVASARIDKGTQLAPGPVPVGHPLAGVEVRILDAHGHPLPAGHAGEVEVRGRYLSSGYWQRPDLTRATFVEDPAGSGVRAYRTGDVGRLLSDGQLVHLGRADGQVKIRGHRVEPAEVERALADIDGVREAAVVAVREPAGGGRGDGEGGGGRGEGEAHLVAFAALESGQAAGPKREASAERTEAAGEAEGAEGATAAEGADEAAGAALRAQLAALVPEPLVPSAVVVLGALPRTAAGKVDRVALGALAQARVERSPAARRHAGSAAPTPTPTPTPTPPTGEALERVIAACWEEALERPGIGLDQSFFALGGHSLAAMRLAALVESRCGVRLDAHVLYEAPTIRAMAERLQAGGGHAPAAPRLLVPIQPRGSQRPLFLVPPAASGVLHFYELVRCLRPGRPVYGIRPRGLVPDEALPRSIQHLASEAVEAARAVQPAGPYLLVGRCKLGGAVAFEMAQQLRAAGEPVGLLAILDASRAPTVIRSRVGLALLHAEQALRRRLSPLKRLAVTLARALEQGGLGAAARDLVRLAASGRARRLALARYAQAERRRRRDQEDVRRAHGAVRAARLGLEAAGQAQLEALSNHHEDLFRRYFARPYAGRIVLIRSGSEVRGLERDWARLARGGLDIRRLRDSEHLTLLGPGHAAAVARELESALAAAGHQ